MITNFESETAPLNEKEQRAAEIIAECMLRFHVGKDKKVTAEQMGRGLAKNYPEFSVTDRKGNIKPYLSGPRIRKIIHYLCVTDMCPLLLGSSEGYYVGNDPDDIRDGIRSQYERIAAQEFRANVTWIQFQKAFPDDPRAQQKPK